MRQKCFQCAYFSSLGRGSQCAGWYVTPIVSSCELHLTHPACPAISNTQIHGKRSYALLQIARLTPRRRSHAQYVTSTRISSMYPPCLSSGSCPDPSIQTSARRTVADWTRRTSDDASAAGFRSGAARGRTTAARRSRRRQLSIQMIKHIRSATCWCRASRILPFCADCQSCSQSHLYISLELNRAERYTIRHEKRLHAGSALSAGRIDTFCSCSEPKVWRHVRQASHSQSCPSPSVMTLRAPSPAERTTNSARVLSRDSDRR